MTAGTRKERKHLEKEEVSALLWGAQRSTDYPFAFDVFALMYVLGMRVGEATLLRYTDLGKTDTSGAVRSVKVPTLKKRVKLKRGQVAPPAGKPDPDHRRVQVPRMEVPVLAHFDWVRRAFDHSRRRGKAALSEFLFPSPLTPERPMTTRYVMMAWKDACAKGGVDPQMTSHSLRHTVTTELARWLMPYFGTTHEVYRRGVGGRLERVIVAGARLEVAKELTKDACGKFLRHAAGRPYGSAATLVYMHDEAHETVPHFERIADWVPVIEGGAIVLPPLEPGAGALRGIG